MKSLFDLNQLAKKLFKKQSFTKESWIKQIDDFVVKNPAIIQAEERIKNEITKKNS